MVRGMTGDHRAASRHLRVAEVMKMPNECAADRSTVEIARLFEVASREDEAIERLDGCVTPLLEVQAARSALQAFTPAELQAALAYRRRTLKGRAS